MVWFGLNLVSNGLKEMWFGLAQTMFALSFKWFQTV